MAAHSRSLEIALSAAWHAGHIGPDLTTVDGDTVQVVHRGAWSHGLGPDFRDAIVLFNGRELRSGAVEMHIRARGWTEHGHHLDPAYDMVILHVVGQHDGADTRRHDGAIVPVVDVGPLERFPIPDMAGWDWDQVGGEVCASRAAVNPGALREILHQLGDVRLAARTARLEARLASRPPGEVLWEELLDGLGYSANREPMRALARLLPLASLEAALLAAPAAPLVTARGILLGAAGFLPLSPAEAHLAGLTSPEILAIEGAWLAHGSPWHEDALSAAAWTRARVRPANHPLPRLLAAAAMTAATCHDGGLLAEILRIVVEASDPAASLRDMTTHGGAGVGKDRLVDMLASGIIPLALALAAHTGNQTLADAASRQWERLPAPAPNFVTRRAARQVAGAAPLGRIGARGAQGLIHLDTTLCQPRRCFECLVAALELSVKG